MQINSEFTQNLGSKLAYKMVNDWLENKMKARFGNSYD